MGKPTRPSIRRLIRRSEPLLLPGAPNALTARLVQEAGFEAVYLSGAGIANTYLGVPDVGLLTETELTAHVAAVVDAVDIPVVVDADTGFGGVLNVARTVRALERAGAAAIELEDQAFPKRCGHFDGKAVVSANTMVGRLNAALDARVDDELVVIARTDARAVNGFEDAIERACMYAEAGADMTFVEAPQTLGEVLDIPRRVPVPQLLNLVEGGKTPIPPYGELAAAGYGAVLYANSAMRAGIKAISETLGILRRDGSTDAALELMATWDERQRLVRRDEFDARASRYESISDGAGKADPAALTDGSADGRGEAANTNEDLWIRGGLE